MRNKSQLDTELEKDIPDRRILNFILGLEIIRQMAWNEGGRDIEWFIFSTGHCGP